MKNKLTLLFIFIIVSSYGQRIKFTYDAAGNQIQRVICLCAPRIANDSIYETSETLADKDMIKDDIYEQVSYYPNPVRNELYVKWKNHDSSQVTSIELYSMTGQSMKSYDNLKDTDIANISFHGYPEGFYNLVLMYSDGNRKTLKIVKK